MISYSLPKPSRLHPNVSSAIVGASRGCSRPRIMLPVVEFKRNRLGQWIPATPEALYELMEHNIELRPSVAPGDVIKDCNRLVWAKFVNSEAR